MFAITRRESREFLAGADVGAAFILSSESRPSAEGCSDRVAGRPGKGILLATMPERSRAMRQAAPYAAASRKSPCAGQNGRLRSVARGLRLLATSGEFLETATTRE